MSGMSGGVFLLATVGGYWMLERSASHKGGLKQVGQVLGWIVIAASLLGLAGAIAQGCGSMSGKKTFCPFTPKKAQVESFTSPAPSGE
ncbi:MAG: hypothetical protein HYY15_02425 [Candidatus Omnitrophica bacterium]|nr:hypothetical protein [Candidatus Omnitrophota bacterium]